MIFQSFKTPEERRLLLLAAVLFLSYLCVALPLSVVPVFVTTQLGLGNVWGGLSVGIAFLSTILSRAHAGNLSDKRGAKVATSRGLACYAAGALVSLLAGLPLGSSWLSLAILIIGRLLIGLGESLAGVGVVAWGVALVGPARSGRVLALVGTAIYGALAVGGPVGVALLDHFGFAGAMACAAVLPCLGLLAIWRVAGVAAHLGAERPSFWSLIGKIWLHGLVVCLQGFGFAAIGAFFILYFRHMGWAQGSFGLTAFGGGFVLVRLLFGSLPDRIGGLPVAIGSLAIETIGQFLVWGAHDPALALAGAFMTGLGCSMVFPSMGREVVRLVAPHLRGVALGGYAAFQDLAYGITGPVAGFAADRAGYGSVFLIGGIAAGAGMLLACYLRRRQLAAA